MKRIHLLAVAFACLALLRVPVAADEAPFHRAELIFPPEHWHNHGSCIVETPGGGLLVCWFHGSGERKADDVKIEGARKAPGATTWGPRFTMADTPGYPDTNCCMFVDPQKRLWLMWPTILANEWHTALMKYRVSSRYEGDGPPQWDQNEVLHVTPGDEFVATVEKALSAVEAAIDTVPQEHHERVRAYAAETRKNAADKLFRRLGWMTRAHPFVLDGKRLIVPLYSDGFSFSLMALTDDWGKTWRTSTPLVGAGNIQPSIVRRKDGSLYTLMRDNGPAPKRLHASESRDGGETWSPVVDSTLPNPGAGAEIINLRSGRWALIYNDTEKGRHSLAVSISDDEGKSWKWTRHLERAKSGEGPAANQFHYPSLIQARDGTLHATYSHHVAEDSAPKDAEGRAMRKSIKHAHFNEAWVMAGDGDAGVRVVAAVAQAPAPAQKPAPARAPVDEPPGAPAERKKPGNPVIEGWYADPEAVIFGKEYWIYPTYSAPYDEQTFFDAFSSRDLVNWTKHPRILTKDDVKWARRAMWAPSVIEKGGKYYLFFGANDIQNDKEVGGIGVAVSDSPKGPFKDHLGKPLVDKFHNGAQPIDQFVFKDKDGTHYLLYGGHRHCNIAKLNADFTGFDPLEGGTLFKEITPGPRYVEGPWMFIKDGRYYMMWSEGGWTGPNYSVAYGIGDSPLGPFEPMGTVLKQDPTIATGAGHHSLLRVPGKNGGPEEWFIVYHRRPLGLRGANQRVTCIDRMEFDDQGKIKPIRITHEGVGPRELE